jgi:hypothetical protein
MRAKELAALMAAVMVTVVLARPARAQDDLPPPFPREGATMVLDNAWGQAWDSTAPPGQPTPMHRHRLDFVGVELADTALSITRLNGNRESFVEHRGDAYFLPRGTTHIEETAQGEPTRRAIIIDLKDNPPPPEPGSSEATTGAPAFPPEGARKIVDNARVTMWSVTWSPEPRPQTVSFPKNSFVVMIDDGARLVAPGAGDMPRSTAAEGTVLFRPAGSAMAVTVTDAPVKGVVIELKQPPGR